jgi:lipopolysaccharide export system permease protein
VSLLTRYITRRFLAGFMVALIVLTSLALAFELMDQADQVLDASHGSGIALLRFTGLRLADMVVQMLPFAALIGTLITMGLLVRHSELIAMWGGGLSTLSVLRTFIPAGLVLCALQFVLDDQAVPRSFDVLRDWNIGKFAHEAITKGDDDAVWLLSGHDIVRIPGAVARRGAIAPVTIFERNADGALTGQITADEAEQRDGVWHLHNVRHVDTATATMTEQPSRTWTGAIHLENLPLIAKGFRELPLVDINRLIANEGFGQRPMGPLVTWFHSRLASVLTPMLMIALVVALAQVSPRRAGFGRVFIGAVGIAFAYLVFDRAAFAMGEAGLLPPLLAAWSAKAVLISVIVAFHLRNEIA